MNFILRTFKLTVLAMLSVFLPAMSLMSCGGSDDPDTPDNTTAEQTVFMYMPWSGSTLYSYFRNNIATFKQGIENNGGLDGRRLLVFISKNGSDSYLMEVTYKNGACVQDTLKTYSFSTTNYTTEAGLTSIINEVKQTAPAKAYSMIVGGHGLGWLPANIQTTKVMARSRNMIGNRPLTRYFGHDSDMEYATDITTLANSVIASGLKMKYILFDDCYMSNVETAYDLKDATDFMVASTCEVMIEGMPYATMARDLLYNDYESACMHFYNYYSAYSVPCGTIGVTDCRELDAMAQIMKNINAMYPDGLDSKTLSSVQKLDGYDYSGYSNTTIFYDFGDYVDKLCEDATLKKTFTNQLSLLVPYKANTPSFYSVYLGGNGMRAINTFSGLTISDPSLNTKYGVTAAKKNTSWYKATH